MVRRAESVRYDAPRASTAWALVTGMALIVLTTAAVPVNRGLRLGPAGMVVIPGNWIVDTGPLEHRVGWCGNEIPTIVGRQLTVGPVGFYSLNGAGLRLQDQGKLWR